MSEVITSKDNSLIKKIVKLCENSRYRHESRFAVVHGIHAVEEAIKFNLVDMVLLEESSKKKYSDILGNISVGKIQLVDSVVMKKLNILDTPTDIIGLIHITTEVVRTKEYSQDCLLLENISDPGNLGAIFRSAQASGVHHILLSSGCVDPFNPKVLRASMGLQFALKIYTNIDLREFIQQYQGCVIATSSYAMESLYTTDLDKGVAWVFGNEGSGISPELLAQIKQQVKIPMPGGAESLNVAMAATVCLFEMVRQRTIS